MFLRHLQSNLKAATHAAEGIGPTRRNTLSLLRLQPRLSDQLPSYLGLGLQLNWSY